MREWLKRVVLKTTVRETVPGVRIPLPPPRSLQRREGLIEIDENGPNFVFFPSDRTGETVLLNPHVGAFLAFFSAGLTSSPVSHPNRANGMRSPPLIFASIFAVSYPNVFSSEKKSRGLVDETSRASNRLLSEPRFFHSTRDDASSRHADRVQVFPPGFTPDCGFRGKPTKNEPVPSNPLWQLTCAKLLCSRFD